MQRRSVSAYVASTLQAAVEDVAEVEIIRLSREASRKFAELLMDPPPLNPAFKKAFADHRRLVRSA
jgi:uncharacterized protein (DUF1778 family)